MVNIIFYIFRRYTPVARLTDCMLTAGPSVAVVYCVDLSPGSLLEILFRNKLIYMLLRYQWVPPIFQ